MHCTKIVSQTKVVTNHNTQFWCKNVFDRPTGVASALIAQFGFLVKSALKVCCTKFSYQTKVVTNQYPQLLCNVTFFDILHHYGVIAASQICSVSRKYCAVLRNRFSLLSLQIMIHFSLMLLMDKLFTSTNSISSMTISDSFIIYKDHHGEWTTVCRW